MTHPRSFIHALASGALLASGAMGQFHLTELLPNPPGTDEGQEAIEIQGLPSASLAGYFLLVIEGDGGGAGTIDVRQDLGTFTTGSNGLLLIRDVPATAIGPAPDPNTSVVAFNWTPDIENGTNTYVLGFGAPPAAGTDLDVENDGVLDAGALAGFTVVDAVTLVENDGAANQAYADDLGFAVLGPFDGVSNPGVGSHTPDAVYRLLDGDGKPGPWAGGDVLGTNPGGPYSFDFAPNEIFGLLEAGLTALDLNPGNANAKVSLKGSPLSISVAAGGVQQLSLLAGASKAGLLYFLVGSVSGTTPGFPVDSVILPLNPDAYFFATLTPNTPLLTPSLGFVNGAGQGTCNFTIPPATVLGGVPFTAHHAYVIFNLSLGVVTFASNAVPVTLNP
ncbi:MAG: hypothetical protein FJ299_13360 [Planctomycetes bacterium]|nr:hypothetical protein [Planctomycetota bacterium]